MKSARTARQQLTENASQIDTDQGAGPENPRVIWQCRHEARSPKRNDLATTSARALCAVACPSQLTPRLSSISWERPVPASRLRDRSSISRSGYASMHAANFQIRDETEQDAAALSQLSAQAFGPGRFGRTPYRIREGVAPVSSLALTAWLNDRLVGGIRFTAVSIGGEGGALLLGPLVVDPVHNGKGYGKALVAEGLA